MKVIYKNNVTSLAVTEENANFPKENMQDTHPRKVWKAVSKDATITTSLSSADACCIFNTNALTCTATLKDALGATVTSSFFDLSGILDYYSWLNDMSDLHYSLWFEYGAANNQGGVHTVEFALDTLNADTILYAGVVYGGLTYTTTYGLFVGAQESIADYAIVKELSNGSRYWKKRDVVRTFTCSSRLKRSSRDFYNFMGKIAQAVGPAPLSWKLTDLNNVDWTVYAFFSEKPRAIHDNVDYPLVTFSLTEEV